MDENKIVTISKEIGQFFVQVTTRNLDKFVRVEVELAEKDLPWKYYVVLHQEPIKVAKDLRKIADWLEKQ